MGHKNQFCRSERDHFRLRNAFRPVPAPGMFGRCRTFKRMPAQLVRSSDGIATGKTSGYRIGKYSGNANAKSVLKDLHPAAFFQRSVRVGGYRHFLGGFRTIRYALDIVPRIFAVSSRCFLVGDQNNGTLEVNRLFLQFDNRTLFGSRRTSGAGG